MEGWTRPLDPRFIVHLDRDGVARLRDYEKEHEKITRERKGGGDGRDEPELRRIHNHQKPWDDLPVLKPGEVFTCAASNEIAPVESQTTKIPSRRFHKQIAHKNMGDFD